MTIQGQYTNNQVLVPQQQVPQQQVVYVQNPGVQTYPQAYTQEQVNTNYQANNQVPAVQQGVLGAIPPVYREEAPQQVQYQQQPVQYVQQVQGTPSHLPGVTQEELQWGLDFENRFKAGHQPSDQEVYQYEIIARKVTAAQQGTVQQPQQVQYAQQPVQYVQQQQPVQYIQQPIGYTQPNYAGQTPVAIASQTAGGYPIDANENKFPIGPTLGGAVFGAIIGAKKSGKPIIGALIGGGIGLGIGLLAR